MYLPMLILLVSCVFAAQIFLCFKARRLVVRLLPTVLSDLAAMVCGVMCMILTGWDVFAWMIFLFCFLIMLGACALAWLIWAIVWFVKRRSAAK